MQADSEHNSAMDQHFIRYSTILWTTAHRKTTSALGNALFQKEEVATNNEEPQVRYLHWPKEPE